MEFNGIQLSAIAKAAKAMIAADGRIDDAEMKTLAREMASFNVEPAQFNQILELSDAMEPVTMLSTLSAMSDHQKKYVSGFLAAIMVCDGDIDENEKNVWQLTSTLMSCPTMTLGEALGYWRNN